jgi:hypothetical protein
VDTRLRLRGALAAACANGMRQHIFNIYTSIRGLAEHGNNQDYMGIHFPVFCSDFDFYME